MNKITNCCLYEISLAGRVQLKEKLHILTLAHVLFFIKSSRVLVFSLTHCHEGGGGGEMGGEVILPTSCDLLISLG